MTDVLTHVVDPAPAEASETRYHQLADQLAAAISLGTLLPITVRQALRRNASGQYQHGGGGLSAT